MPAVELVAVGTELLLGQLVDTNTSFVADHLAQYGIDVHATHAIGDNRERIAALLREALARSDGAITTGGLGPTVDDLTKEAVCDVLGVGVETYVPAVVQMESFFARTGREMRPNNRKQAELPAGSTPLDNPNGTAPGFVAFSAEGKIVACMPGVPREMKPMLVDRLMPVLRERFGAREAIYTRVLHTIGIGESEIDHRIDDLFRSAENPKIAVLAHDYRADVKIMAKSSDAGSAQAAIAPLQREIETRLEGHIFGTDDTSLSAAVHGALRARGLTVATAESCTGGRVAAALTQTAGASETFVGGIVAYDNAVKAERLGVPRALLERFGAVSAETAQAMAAGAMAAFESGLAVAVTGIAGPGGGTPEKPVGLVWVAIASRKDASRQWKLLLHGDRDAVQQRATVATLGIIWRQLMRDGGDR